MKIKIKKNILKESLGSYERGNIKVEVLENKKFEYDSIMSIELKDRIIYQALTIDRRLLELESNSEGLRELRSCYPANFSDYPEEIQKMKPKPWITNLNANPMPDRRNVTRFHLGHPDQFVEVEVCDINFVITGVTSKDGKPVDWNAFSDGIFGSNSRAALSFFREIMNQIGEYVKQNPWLIYSFTGADTDEEERRGLQSDEVNKRTRLYLTALKRLQRRLPGEWVITHPHEGETNSVMFFKCPMSGLNEVSSMAGGAVQGFAGAFTEEEEKLIQEMYSSAAIMGSGSGRIPAERSPEAHKRYVRIRFKRQGLQNFKPNRYFPSKQQQLGEGKLNTYSNIWKSWKKPADFQKWLLSQVEKLAKYRKGQGKFDFKFFDKVYMDLKDFVEGKYLAGPYSFDRPYGFDPYEGFSPYDGKYTSFRIGDRRKKDLRAINMFYTLTDMELDKLKNDIISNLSVKSKWLYWSREKRQQLKSAGEKYREFYNAENQWLSIPGTFVNVRGHEHYRKIAPDTYIPDYEIREIGDYKNYDIGNDPEETSVAAHEMLKQALKDMEKLKKSYPWSKRNLPNIQRHLGIYEKKVKKH